VGTKENVSQLDLNRKGNEIQCILLNSELLFRADTDIYCYDVVAVVTLPYLRGVDIQRSDHHMGPLHLAVAFTPRCPLIRPLIHHLK